MTEPKTSDNRPTEVKDFMTAISCDKHWYTNKFTNCSEPNWFILHPIPWTKLYHEQKGIGNTREWGTLPERPSIGSVDFYRGSWRFLSPWGVSKRTSFHDKVIVLKQKLKAVIIEEFRYDDSSKEKGISGPIEKWYIHLDLKKERLCFITTNYHVMIHQIIEYMRILQEV